MLGVRQFDRRPLLLGEFTDVKARRYVMLVNNSMAESVNVGIRFPGQDVKVYSWDWSGKERAGGAYCAGRQVRNKQGLAIYHWLAPGQETVYRVESRAASNEPIPRP